MRARRIDSGSPFEPSRRHRTIARTTQSTADARDAVRLFNIPGMTHCGGGPALDNFDPLTALENWREKGQAPEFMIATGQAFPGKSQPLCAYPKIATYTGGDGNKAESFECR